MKKIRLRIGKHLKSLVLGLAFIGGTLYFSQTANASGVTFAVGFGMVATMKKNGVKFEDGDEEHIKQLDTAIAEGFATWIKENGTLEKDSFLKFWKANSAEIIGAVDMKEFKIDGKSMDEWSRNLMTNVQKAIDATDNMGKMDENVLRTTVMKHMGKIVDLHAKKSKTELTINAKDAVIMTTDGVVDTTDIDAVTDITESFRIDAFIPKRLSNQYIFNLVNRVVSQEIPESITWHEEGDKEGAMAVIAESVLKPLMSFSLIKRVTQKLKAAGKIVVTEEVPMFRKRVWAIIQELFRVHVLRDYVAIVTANIIGEAAPYTGTSLDGTITTPTDFHAIGAVAAQIESLNFSPDVMILHPQDKWRIALATDAEGRFYTTMLVTNGDGNTQLLGFRVVTSTDQEIGTFTIGESGLYTIEETPIQIRFGYGVSMNGGTAEADFDYNRFRIIGEVFFHQKLPLPYAGAFVKASFDEVKELLATDEVL